MSREPGLEIEVPEEEKTCRVFTIICLLSSCDPAIGCLHVS
ncbi:hypothetical protein NPIL_542911, partial [Nephila pilipes]